MRFSLPCICSWCPSSPGGVGIDLGTTGASQFLLLRANPLKQKLLCPALSPSFLSFFSTFPLKKWRMKKKMKSGEKKVEEMPCCSSALLSFLFFFVYRVLFQPFRFHSFCCIASLGSSHFLLSPLPSLPMLLSTFPVDRQEKGYFMWFTVWFFIHTVWVILMAVGIPTGSGLMVMLDQFNGGNDVLGIFSLVGLILWGIQSAWSIYLYNRARLAWKHSGIDEYVRQEARKMATAEAKKEFGGDAKSVRILVFFFIFLSSSHFMPWVSVLCSSCSDGW